MNQPPKLYIFLGILATLLMVGFIWSTHGSHDAPSNTDKAPSQKIFDVATGDTNNEVLQSLVSKQNTLEKENESLIEKNKELVSKGLSRSEDDFNKALEQNNAAIQTTISSVKQELENEIAQVSKTKGTGDQLEGDPNTHYPMGNGDDTKTADDHSLISTVHDVENHSMRHDLSNPADSSDSSVDSTDPSGQSDKNAPSSSDTDSPSLPSDVDSSASLGSLPKPVYTIPALSTVTNVRLMSPIIGEVPVNGQLQAPAFPFKAIISERDTENMFTANGIPVPAGVTGSVLQGYSVGSMSLGCARSYVMKILFVFQDGHFEVFPEDQQDSDGSQTSVYPTKTIGYLSDAYNNACVTGKYLTDAPKVIASLTSLAVVAGTGDAIAQAQEQTLTNITNGTSGSVLSGSLGKYAAGIGVGDASKAALDWYKARVSDIFDAVFIPSTLNGQPRQMIFNVTKTIPIDFNKNGRQLSYENDSQFSAIDHSFG
jgi:integrating conjugative element protein (TIGR03752 family)